MSNRGSWTRLNLELNRELHLKGMYMSIYILDWTRKTIKHFDQTNRHRFDEVTNRICLFWNVLEMTQEFLNYVMRFVTLSKR